MNSPRALRGIFGQIFVLEKRVGTPEILEWRFLGVAPGCGRVDELRGFRFSDRKHDFFEDIYIYRYNHHDNE